MNKNEDCGIGPVVVDPMISLRIGPCAGIMIREEDYSWSNLPPGTYKPKFEQLRPHYDDYILVWQKVS